MLVPGSQSAYPDEMAEGCVSQLEHVEGRPMQNSWLDVVRRCTNSRDSTMRTKSACLLVVRLLY